MRKFFFSFSFLNTSTANPSKCSCSNIICFFRSLQNPCDKSLSLETFGIPWLRCQFVTLDMTPSHSECTLHLHSFYEGHTAFKISALTCQSPRRPVPGGRGSLFVVLFAPYHFKWIPYFVQFDCIWHSNQQKRVCDLHWLSVLLSHIIAPDRAKVTLCTNQIDCLWSPFYDGHVAIDEDSSVFCFFHLSYEKKRLFNKDLHVILLQ